MRLISIILLTTCLAFIALPKGVALAGQDRDVALRLMEGNEGGPSGGKEGVELILFWRDGCPHCKKELAFLEGLKAEHLELKVFAYELSEPGNAEAFRKLMARMNVSQAGVPTTIIGNAVFMGFSDDVANQIVQQIRQIKRNANVEGRRTITIPFMGEVDPEAFSLPVFTIVIAGLDSFNPCALFVLLFLLTLLIHARSRARMAIIGGTFVFFSGLVYFLFMAAWLNLFFIIGKVALITTVAGIIALLVGVINVKDFFAFKRGVSLGITEEASGKLIRRMRGLLNAESMPSMLIGTVVLAISANAYELLCTAGFPMVYTRVLTLNELGRFSYYMYLVFYNVVYVIPLLVVVVLFTWKLGARKLTEWQGRVLKLLSGTMMLTLGLALVAKPEILNSPIAAAGMLFVAIAFALLICMFFSRDDCPS